MLFRYFHDKKSVASSLIVLGTLKQDCYVKANEILGFPPSTNHSVTIGLNFL